MSRTRGLLLGWVLAMLGIALFARLGAWQLARMHEKQAMLAGVHLVLQQRRPQPLSVASDPMRARDYDWTVADGRFVDAPAVLLDNQARDERPGVRAYRVFQPASPRVAPVLVELGWLPVPADRRMPAVPRIAGPAHVAGLLAPPPSPGLGRAVAMPQADGNLLALGLDMPTLRRDLHQPRLAARVLKLDPALPLGYVRDLDILPNTLPPTRHLGYAVQWFGLALTVLATALVLTFRKPRAHPTP
ncbi:MAG: SURF1 family protein [Luteimonas sp.]